MVMTPVDRAMTIAQTVAVHMAVSAISLEDGRQPDQLSAAAIGQLIDANGEVNAAPHGTVKGAGSSARGLVWAM
jgi:hypothetical protein